MRRDDVDRRPGHGLETRQPLAAARTGAMVAGVVNQFAPSAIAGIKLRAQRGSAARQNSADGASMRRQQTRSELLFVRRPMAAQDLSQGNHLKADQGFKGRYNAARAA